MNTTTTEELRGTPAQASAGDLPPVLTVEECARFLRIGRTACYEAVRLGSIPSIRLGRLLRIPREALLTLLATGELQNKPADVTSAAEIKRVFPPAR